MIYIDIYPNNLYTAAYGDNIRFFGSEGESFLLRANDITTQIFIVNGSALWQYNIASESYLPNHYFTLTNISDNATYPIADKEINLEVVDINPFVFYFTNSFEKCGYWAMSDSLQNDVIEILNEAPGSKYWQDYNTDRKEWLMLKSFAEQGIICSEKVPNEPKIEEYI
jgi:hypothetical protein